MDQATPGQPAMWAFFTGTARRGRARAPAITSRCGGRGANDMFAVIDVFGNFTDTLMAEHYDGTTWTPVTVPPIMRSNEFGIAGFGASEMWLWNDSVILHHP